MKTPKFTSRPGFEFIFAAGIAAIFIIPSVVMAQTRRDTEIKITNGDTVINGKNIKTLSATERADAMKDLNGLRGRAGGRRQIIVERRRDGDANMPMIAEGHIAPPQYGDYKGTDANTRLRLKRLPGDSARVFSFRYEDGKPMPPMPPATSEDVVIRRFDRGAFDGTPNRVTRMMVRPDRRNSQRFSYSNTDGSGVTTDINFSVSEPREAGKENTLDLTDIKLVPDFTSGKTALSFMLPAKTTAEVELTNSDGKTVWADRATGGSFTRSFPLPLNGMYHLKVKQGGKTAVKDIMKEQ